MRTLKPSLLSLGLMLVFTACDVNQKANDIFIGKWTISNIEVADSNHSMDALLILVMPEINEDYVKFTPGNQYEIRNKEDSLLNKGDYELSEDGKTLTTSENGASHVMGIKSVSKDQISLLSEAGTSFTLNKKY